jgi:alpha-ribazole phosphatase/probable phosphoglycerate mutase
MNETTTVDLLRHGKPEGGRRYRGQIDDPLSPEGWEEMWASVDGTPSPWQHIVSSPLVRCQAFAQALGEKLRIPVTPDPRLREVGFGSWEGHTADELRAQDPDIIARFYHDPVNNRPAGAEPLQEFSDRVSEAFRDILAHHRGRHVLVVTHAGVIRATLTHVLNAPLGAMYRMSIATASLSRIRVDGERPPTVLFSGRRVA